jgi:hypothetical protein
MRVATKQDPSHQRKIWHALGDPIRETQVDKGLEQRGRELYCSMGNESVQTIKLQSILHGTLPNPRTGISRSAEPKRKALKDRDNNLLATSLARRQFMSNIGTVH